MLMRRKHKAIFIPMAITAMLAGGTLVSLAPPASALGTNDADLVVSFEEPGVQEAAFTDVTLTIERFGNAPACTVNPCGLHYDDSDWTSDVGTFSAGFSRLAGDEKAGTAFSVENKTTSSPRERMGVVRNTGAANEAILRISSTASDLKYLGFWWGSGNTGAGANLIRFYRDNALVADYDAGDIDNSLIDADGTLRIGDYNGNPNWCWPQTNPATRPAAVACTDTDSRPRATANDSNAGLPLPGWVIGEPFLFVHFRLEAGFDEVRFERNTGGFEMDNLTVSNQIPAFTEDEVASTPTFTLDATDLILADPRDSSVEFNGVSLTGTAFRNTAAANLVTRATLCVAVTADGSSTTPVDSPRFNLVATSASLTVSRTTNRARWSLSGTKAAVAAASQTITLQTTDSDALVTSGNSMWLRVGVMNGAVTPAQCASSQSINTLQIRGLTLTASRRVDLDIEN